MKKGTRVCTIEAYPNLEREPSRHLNVPRGACGIWQAEVLIDLRPGRLKVCRRVKTRKLSVIPDTERFPADRQSSRLAEFEPLGQGEIPVAGPGAVQDIRARITK